MMWWWISATLAAIAIVGVVIDRKRQRRRVRACDDVYQQRSWVNRGQADVAALEAAASRRPDLPPAAAAALIEAVRALDRPAFHNVMTAHALSPRATVRYLDSQHRRLRGVH